MTLPDPNLDRPGGADQGELDRLPKSQRNQDEMRTETSHGLAVDGSRPLTSEEKAAAEHDHPAAERVYAPATERVPVQPVPGHREFVEHPDEDTPERQAAQHTAPTEPSFTRVDRPSAQQQSQSREWSPSPASPSYSSPTSTPYASPGSTPYASPGTTPYSAPYTPTSTFHTESTSSRGWLGMPLGIGTVALLACGGIGVWLYMRWQRERNKPINRFRRQARQAMQIASEMREYVPDYDMRQPQYGAAASLLPIALLVWRMAQSRNTSRGPVETVADADWQKRLTNLKERWSPKRVELEKVSISRH